MWIQRAPGGGLLKRYLTSKSGATAIEYAIIAGGIALAIIVVVNATGQALKPSYEAVGTGLTQN